MRALTWILALLTGLAASGPTPARNGPIDPGLAAGGEPVVVPGGVGFVRSVVGLQPDAGEEFLPALAEHLLQPRVVDLGRRLEELVEELLDLREFLARLEARHGEVIPALGGRGGAAHEAAAAILEHIGVRPVPPEAEGGSPDYEYFGGRRESRRREVLSHLGISLGRAARGWVAGEPIELDIRDGAVAIPFGGGTWRAELLDGAGGTGTELFLALVRRSAALETLVAYAHLDAPTRATLHEHLGLRRPLRDASLAAGFRRASPYLRVGPAGRMRLPGGSRAAWEALLGPWRTPGELLRLLVDDANAAALHLWRALSLVPESRARWLATLGRTEPADVAAWARRLRDAVRLPSVGDRLRWTHDVAELFVALRLADGGGIEWPGGAAAWEAALGLAVADDGTADDGATDARILVALLRRSDPQSGDGAIAGFLRVTTALRYQPVSTVRAAVPELFRHHPSVAPAYAFLVTPTPLAPDTVVAFLAHLRAVDGLEPAALRVEALRQLQASLILTHRFLLNGMLPDGDRDRVLRAWLDASPPLEARPGGLAGWWREALLPAVGRALAAGGFEASGADPREVLFAGLVGALPPQPLEVDELAYRFAPARRLGNRILTHLARQRTPPLHRLLRIDAVAAAVADGGPEGIGSELAGELAGELEEHLGELRLRVPPGVLTGAADEALPVPVPRPRMMEAGDELVRGLRDLEARRRDVAVEEEGRHEPAPTAEPETGPLAGPAGEVRRAVGSWLGDALVGLVYALHLGDPEAFVLRDRLVAWMHVLEPLERPRGVAGWGAWERTAETFDPRQGRFLRNALFGVPAALRRWQLGELVLGAGAGRGDEVLEETWARMLASLHPPSLTEAPMRRVSGRLALARRWVETATAAGNPRAPPPQRSVVELEAAARDGSERRPETLEEAVRRLLAPPRLHRFLQAVAEGDRGRASELLGPGDRYLLGRIAEGGTEDGLPAAGRWALDQAVGMPAGRWAVPLGLTHPPEVPLAEAGSGTGDPATYARLVDLRVAVIEAMRERRLPAALQPAMLSRAVADVVAAAGPRSDDPRALAATLRRRVDATAVGDWLVDMAFADELVPVDDPAAVAAADGAAAPGTTDGPEPERPASRPVGPLARGLEVPVGRLSGGEGQAPTFGARVDLLLVDAGVWDGGGRFVADLEAEDFEVLVDGVEVRPEFVRLEGSADGSGAASPLPRTVAERVEEQPRNVVLIADLMNTPGVAWERILDETLAFVEDGLTARDRVAVVELPPGGGIRLVNGFTSSRQAIRESLLGLDADRFSNDAADGRVREFSAILCDNGGCDGFCPVSDECRPIGAAARFPNCRTECTPWEQFKIRRAQGFVQRAAGERARAARATLQSLERVAEALAGSSGTFEAKTVVLLSAGFEMRPGEALSQTLRDYALEADLYEQLQTGTSPGYQPSADLAALVRKLQACRCTVYAIDATGLFGATGIDTGGAYRSAVRQRDRRMARQGSLNAIADDTGGRAFFGSDADIGFRRIAEDTRLRYVLGVSVADAGIEVEEGERRWHRLEVRSRRDGLEVRAREGFYWPPAPVR